MADYIIIPVERIYHTIPVLNQLQRFQSQTLTTCLRADEKRKIAKFHINISKRSKIMYFKMIHDRHKDIKRLN